MKRAHFCVLLAMMSSACGSRSGLQEPKPHTRDAGEDVDVDAHMARDAGPDGGGDLSCEVGDPFEIFASESRLADPVLARIGERALLAFTVLDEPPIVMLLPITATGEARGALARIPIDGRGGTLIARTLGDEVPGFTHLFTSPEGELVAARTDPDLAEVLAAGFGLLNQMVRPGLAMTRVLSVSAWDEDDRVTHLVVNDLETRTSVFTMPAGRSPVLAVDEREDVVRVASHLGEIAFLETFDRQAMLLDSRTESAIGINVILDGVRIVDGEPDVFAIFGRPARRPEESYLEVGFGFPRLTWMPDAPIDDLAIAYDTPSGWLAGASGVMHETSDGSRAPHVFFHALRRDGGSRTQRLAGPLEPESAPLRPAIMTTDDPRGTFLVVWAHNDGNGFIEGVLVLCP